MQYIKAYFLRVYHSPRQLIIHLLFLLSLAYFYTESNHETVLFKNIVKVAKIESAGKNDTVFVKNIMVSINKMMRDRNNIFNNTEELSIKAKLITSVDADLMYGAGACGGFTKVLARSLKMAGYTTRIGQMQVNGKYGGHILLETYLPSLQKWVIMDPLFLLVFTNPKGVWASFSEVHNNWPYYKTQIQHNYNYNYNYEGIRYTNWSKVPFLGTMAYRTIELLKGKEYASTFSLRPYLLDSYRLYKWIIGMIYILYVFFSFLMFSKRKSVNA